MLVIFPNFRYSHLIYRAVRNFCVKVLSVNVLDLVSVFAVLKLISAMLNVI